MAKLRISAFASKGHKCGEFFAALVFPEAELANLYVESESLLTLLHGFGVLLDLSSKTLPMVGVPMHIRLPMYDTYRDELLHLPYPSIVIERLVFNAFVDLHCLTARRRDLQRAQPRVVALHLHDKRYATGGVYTSIKDGLVLLPTATVNPLEALQLVQEESASYVSDGSGVRC